MHLKYRVTYQRHYSINRKDIVRYDFTINRLPYGYIRGFYFNNYMVRNNLTGIKIWN